jgi:hypothetical protein
MKFSTYRKSQLLFELDVNISSINYKGSNRQVPPKKSSTYIDAKREEEKTNVPVAINH